MRGRRFASNQDIERHIANGFGAGAGAEYVPWLRVQDVPSMGRSWKIQGVKIDRIHHLLSDLERAYFLLCEFSEDVVDIREQYPLLPLDSTQAIARAFGVRYPRYKNNSVPLVMTTDFLLTVKQPNGDLTGGCQLPSPQDRRSGERLGARHSPSARYGLRRSATVVSPDRHGHLHRSVGRLPYRPRCLAAPDYRRRQRRPGRLRITFNLFKEIADEYRRVRK